MQEIARRTKDPSGLRLRSWQDLLQFSTAICKSPWVPEALRGRPMDCAIVILYGREVGLGIIESLRSLFLIKGKPSMYTDTMLALVQRSGLLEGFKEELVNNGGNITAVCRVKRKGLDWVTSQFSMQDAKRGGLLGKDAWVTYPQRMLQLRARSWALRTAFADVVRGLYTVEEAMDIPEKNGGGQAVQVVESGVVDTEITAQPARDDVVVDVPPEKASEETSQNVPAPEAPKEDPALAERDRGERDFWMRAISQLVDKLHAAGVVVDLAPDLESKSVNELREYHKQLYFQLNTVHR